MSRAVDHSSPRRLSETAIPGSSKVAALALALHRGRAGIVCVSPRHGFRSFAKHMQLVFSCLLGVAAKVKDAVKSRGDPELPKSLAVSWHGKPLPSKKGSHTSETDAVFEDEWSFRKTRI